MTDSLLGQAPETPTELQPTTGQEPVQDNAPDVDALLKEVRQLRSEAAKWRTKLRQTEEAEEQRKRAEMTELDRLKADLETERQARAQAEQQRRGQLIRTQVISTAARLGFNDPDDAARMLDVSALEPDETGRVAGLEEELRELLKAKPYLARQTTGTISPTNPAGGSLENDQQRMARIYGKSTKSNVFGGGEGGGVVWNPKTTE